MQTRDLRRLLSEAWEAADRRMAFVPPVDGVLLDFMARHVAAGIGHKFRKCSFCGAEFQVGPGTGRRADAKFCTTEHQVFFNRRKQAWRKAHKSML